MTEREQFEAWFYPTVSSMPYASLIDMCWLAWCAARDTAPDEWKPLAYANLGVVRDQMRPEQVEAVQDWLEGVYPTAAPAQTEWDRVSNFPLHAAPAEPQHPVAMFGWEHLLRESQENFVRNFGENASANWIYADLAELFTAEGY
jgi:hypothetical protein